jgi:hypothetical protein
LKDKSDESKGSFWQNKYDLHRIVIKKANFAEMFNKTKNTDDKASKRVCGQFLLSFDLDKIFKNISMLRQIKD